MNLLQFADFASGASIIMDLGAVDTNLRRRGNSHSNLVSVNAKDGNPYMAADDDFLSYRTRKH